MVLFFARPSLDFLNKFCASLSMWSLPAWLAELVCLGWVFLCALPTSRVKIHFHCNQLL